MAILSILANVFHFTQKFRRNFIFPWLWKNMNKLDVAASFVFILLGTFIYSPIGLLYGINMLSISSFISMLLLIVAGINIVKRKNRIFTISCLVIVLSLLLYEGIKAFMEKEIIIKIIFLGNVIINMIILLLTFSSLFIVLKEKFANFSRHNVAMSRNFHLQIVDGYKCS